MREIIALAVGFLCGAIPFGVILVRLSRGIDVRTVGSGNIGATNVARAAGWAPGVAVLVLDAAKGAAALLLGRAIAGTSSPWLAGALVCAAVAGHIFTPFLRFKGGKGVATALGALAAFDPGLILIGAGTFAVILTLTRIVSLGSVCGALAVAVGAFVRWGPTTPAFFIALTAALVIGRHSANIRRILAREEPQLGRGGSRARGSS